MLTVGLLAQLTAKDGREDDLEDLLRSARELAAAEEQTVAWFAVRIDRTHFATFDAFRDDAGRDAHLGGPTASALMDNADRLLAEAPTISRPARLPRGLTGHPVAAPNPVTRKEAGGVRVWRARPRHDAC